MTPPTSPDQIESLKAQLEKANAQVDLFKKAHIDALHKLTALVHGHCSHFPCTREARHVLGAAMLLCCDHFDAQVLQLTRLRVNLPGTNLPRPTDSHGDLVLYFESQCNIKTRIPGCFPCALGARVRRWVRKLKPWVVFD